MPNLFWFWYNHFFSFLFWTLPLGQLRSGIAPNLEEFYADALCLGIPLHSALEFEKSAT